MAPCLIATLGGKAQVVTLALDALLAQGVPIAAAYVVHHAPPDPTHRLHRALAQLQHAFRGGHYRSQRCRLHAVPLRDHATHRLADLDSPAAADAAWTTFHTLLGELKLVGHPLHLCVTGGRRLMGLVALSAAALHFTANDRVWHLYTPDPLRAAAGEGAMLHAPPDGPQPSLIEVPIMPGSEVFPSLRALLGAAPAEVRAARRRWLDDADRARCQAVWGALRPRPRAVLARIAQGATPQEVAAALTIELSTTRSHLNAIYHECRRAWALPDAAPLDFRWLEQRFGRWEGVGEG